MERGTEMWEIRRTCCDLVTSVCHAPPINRLRSFIRDQSGTTIIPIALSMPILVGVMGLAAEASYWFLHQRAMQNAADAAAIAAATNGGSNYADEAKAVAAQYGFRVTGNIAVTATNPTTASGCTNKCYAVTISNAV